MTEPTTAAGQALLSDNKYHHPGCDLNMPGAVERSRDPFDGVACDCGLPKHIAAIEAEARNALPLLLNVVDAARELNMTMPDRGDGDPLSALDDALAALDSEPLP